MLHRLRRSRALVVPAALGAVAALALSACGGTAKGAEVASLAEQSSGSEVTTTTAAAGSEEQVLKFVACLREQGLDVPDPKFDADGNISGRIFGPESGIDPRNEATRTALDTCRSQVGDVGVGPGGGRGRRFDPTQMQAVFNEFTSCLRTNGIEVDDITLGPPGDGDRGGQGTGASGPSGASGPRGGFGPPPDGERPRDGQGFDPTRMLMRRLDLDENDPKVQAAVAECEPALTAAMQNLQGGDEGGPAGASGTTGSIKFS